jgi:hypothetical protein
MPQVGFEPTITAFERAKTVHALDRAATVIGTLRCGLLTINEQETTYFVSTLKTSFFVVCWQPSSKNHGKVV